MLKDVRAEIQKIDDQIIELMAKRTGLAEKVLDAKRKERVEINDEEQNRAVLKRAVEVATERGMDAGAVKRIYEVLIEMSIERQRELSGRGKLQP
ncbi:MAG: chorismate mutase [Methanocellales archaeon]|nr:chorismate mutase [Methanocellales archaeon]